MKDLYSQMDRIGDDDKSIFINVAKSAGFYLDEMIQQMIKVSDQDLLLYLDILKRFTQDADKKLLSDFFIQMGRLDVNQISTFLHIVDMILIGNIYTFFNQMKTVSKNDLKEFIDLSYQIGYEINNDLILAYIDSSFDFMNELKMHSMYEPANYDRW